MKLKDMTLGQLKKHCEQFPKGNCKGCFLWATCMDKFGDKYPEEWDLEQEVTNNGEV